MIATDLEALALTAPPIASPGAAANGHALETETRNELTPDCGCSRLDPGQTRPESLQDRFQGVDAGPIRQLVRVITLVE